MPDRRALVKHGIEWTADWPYNESGHNSRGREDYIMMVEAADGDWVSTHMVDGEQKRWLTIATESSWADTSTTSTESAIPNG